jgi:hypothetical protein
LGLPKEGIFGEKGRFLDNFGKMERVVGTL